MFSAVTPSEAVGSIKGPPLANSPCLYTVPPAASSSAKYAKLALLAAPAALRTLNEEMLRPASASVLIAQEWSGVADRPPPAEQSAVDVLPAGARVPSGQTMRWSVHVAVWP